MAQPPITIAIFAKPQVPGAVKTRLAPVLGDDGAAALARAFLRDAVALVRGLPWARAVIATTEPETDAAFPEDHPKVPRWDQGGGDLGARLERVVARGLAGGARAVIALGADCPGLPVAALDAARRALQRHQSVLGPSHDGGYYLIGLRACPRGLLGGVPWSASNTFEATLSKLAGARLSVRITQPHFDVDTPDDLTHLEAMLKRDRRRAPFTADILERLGRL